MSQWELSSAVISSSQNSVHTSEMEICPPKTACGCPCGGVIFFSQQVTHAVLSPHGMHLSLYSCIYWEPQSVQLVNTTTTTTTTTATAAAAAPAAPTTTTTTATATTTTTSNTTTTTTAVRVCWKAATATWSWMTRTGQAHFLAVGETWRLYSDLI